jgi:hypothetical protein
MAMARRISPQKLLALGMGVGALCTFGIGWSTSVPLTLGLQFVNGLFFPCIHIGINTLILQNSRESYVGRVMGVLNPMFMGMMVIGMSCAGAAKSALTLGFVYGLSGGLFLLGTTLLVPLFRLAVRQPVSPAAE